MRNRATAWLMFGSTITGEWRALDTKARKVWSQIVGSPPPRGEGLWGLCEAAGLSHAHVGWSKSDMRAVGYVLAYAYSVETVDVPNLDVPDFVRAKVTRFCAALGCDGPPRVMLVPGYE